MPVRRSGLHTDLGWALFFLVASLEALFLHGCEYAKVALPMLPSDVQPTPKPSAMPPPTFVSGPLRASGERLVGPDNRPVDLLGIGGVCCDSDATPEDDGKLRGWPWASRDFLQRMHGAGLNFIHIRLGPFTLEGEGDPKFVPYEIASGETAALMRGYRSQSNERAWQLSAAAGGRFSRTSKVDLGKWSQLYFSELRAFIEAAGALGIIVEADLIDVWVLAHQLGPWSKGANVQGFEGGSLAILDTEPHQHAQRWVAKVVEEIGRYPNVVFQDGNEASRKPSFTWAMALQTQVKAELAMRGYGDRPRGTNTEDPGIEAAFDYIERHAERAQPKSTRYVMVNEYTGELSVDAVVREARAAREMGTACHYWLGGHTPEQVEATLKGLREVVDGVPGPAPQPRPAACPPISRFRASVHNTMDGEFRPTPEPVAGGQVVIDSTPLFGGQPCNGEHPGVCGGRACEDPRGYKWRQVGGPVAEVRRQNRIEECGIPVDPSRGYQLRVGKATNEPGIRLEPGEYVFEVYTDGDAVDCSGQRVPGHASGVVTFEVSR